MGNIDNKEKEFAEILKLVTRTARENRNVISKEQVAEAFSELELDEKQLEMVYDYLKAHKIGVDEAADTDFDLTEEETNYLNDYLESLNALVGRYVNLEYRLPNGAKVRFLDDQTTYLGNQLESEIVEGLCYGVIANMDFIMICTYEQDGVNPELILYKKR